MKDKTTHNSLTKVLCASYDCVHNVDSRCNKIEITINSCKDKEEKDAT
jgi:hypothetical protein